MCRLFTMYSMQTIFKISTVILLVRRCDANPLETSELEAYDYKGRTVIEMYFDRSGARLRREDFSPENRRKQCIRYEGYCDREGEPDNCCLERGGVCKTRPGRGRTCVPPPEKTLLQRVCEEQITGWGFSGGAIYSVKTTKVFAANGAGRMITDEELVAVKEMFKKLQTCFNVGYFTLASIKFNCHGIKTMDYEINSKKYKSYWMQGITEDDVRGAIVISSIDVILVGIHELNDLDWWPANFRLGRVHENVYEFEKACVLDSKKCFIQH